MYISDGMELANQWMEENNVSGDPSKLKYHSIGHLLDRFADDLLNNKNNILSKAHRYNIKIERK